MARLLRAALASLLVLASCAASPPDLEGDSPSPPPGTWQRSLVHGAEAVERRYRLYVPAGHEAGRPLPLLVLLHGGLSSAATLQSRTRLEPLADREGFLLAYPDGRGLYGMLRHWNGGHCCGKAAAAGWDDVGFVSRVIDDAASVVAVDRTRVYVGGFSNGGMLAWRYAALHPERVAAAAIFSSTIMGALGSDEEGEVLPRAALPVPLLVFYGSEDRRVPAGHVEASVARWLSDMDCENEPQRRALRGDRVQVRAWRRCRDEAEVVVYRLVGWGHRWPGKHFSQRLDESDPLHGFDGDRIVWDFFKRHARSSVTAGRVGAVR